MKTQLHKPAAEEAVALDPESAKAHLALAFIEMLNGWNWRKARALVDRTLELAPGDAEAMSMLAHLATITGKNSESIALAQRALDLDPLNAFTNFAFARSLGSNGRFGEMEMHSARAAEEMPQGRPRQTGLAFVRAAQGRLAESEAELDALKEKRAKHAPYQIAEVYAFRGEVDLAFEWIEKSYNWRDSGTVLVRCDHMLKNLHSNPRWEPFLRKMNLAADQLD